MAKRLLPVLVSAEGTPLIVPTGDILARAPAASRARAEALLRDLTDFRLLTSLRDERGREALTPVHTTLIRAWRLMREALEGNAELEAFLRRFERDAREWEASERDPAKLWSAAALRDFDTWKRRLGEVQLTPAQLAFRDAVTAQARRSRLLRWSLVALLAALAIGGTIAGIAFSAKADEAAELQRDAESQRTVAVQQRALAESEKRQSIEHRREADDLILHYMLGDLRARLEPMVRRRSCAPWPSRCGATSTSVRAAPATTTTTRHVARRCCARSAGSSSRRATPPPPSALCASRSPSPSSSRACTATTTTAAAPTPSASASSRGCWPRAAIPAAPSTATSPRW